MSETELEQFAQLPGVRLFESNRYLRMSKFSIALLKGLPALVRDADFVHIHGQFEFPVVWAYLLCRFYGRPFGVQAHGGLEPFDLDRHSSRQKELFLRLLGKKKLRDASYVFFASQSEAERAAPYISPSQRLIAPLGVSDHEPECPELPAGVMDKIRCESKKTFLYLGRFAEKKQPMLLLEAWAEAKLESAHLIMAGPDDFYSGDDLRLKIEQVGIGGSSSVVGNLTPAEAAWLYDQSDVFVLPSLNENFGLTVVEAMLHDCFVVTTSEVASSTYVVAAGGGIVTPVPTVHVLSEALKSANDQHSLAGGNRAYIAQNVGWRRTAEVIDARIREELGLGEVP